MSNEKMERAMALVEEQEISRDVDAFCSIKAQIDELNELKKDLQASITKRAKRAFDQGKGKTVVLKGSSGNSLKVTKSETVDVKHPDFLYQIFGAAYDDEVKVKSSYELSKAAKAMLASIYLGEIERITIEDVINTLNTDNTTKALLKGAIRGEDQEKDKKAFIRIAQLDEDDAESYAYFAKEAKAWESFSHYIAINKNEDILEDVLETARQSVTVKQGYRVTAVAASA